MSAAAPRRGYVLGVLMLVYGCNFLDRQILVILQEPIKADMGLSDAQLGLLTGFAFAVFYVIAGIPIAYLADRGNRRNIIALAVTFWSAMTMLCGAAQNYLQLVLLRIGVGIGEAGSIPPSHSMISDLFAPGERARAFALFTIGLYFGVAAGYVFGGQFGEYIGWRHALLIAGIPGILLALLLRFTVAEPLRTPSATAPPGFGQAVAALTGQPMFWLVTLATAAGTFVIYGTGSFNPSYLMRSHGLPLGTTGIVLAVTSSVSGIIGTWLGGVLADRLGRRDPAWYLRICLVGQALSVPFSVIAYLSPGLHAAVAALFVAHVLVVFMLAPSVAVIQGMVVPEMRALASSVFFFVVNLIGLGLGPLAVGLVSDALTPQYGSQGLRYAQVSAAGVGLVAAVLFGAAIVRSRQEKAQLH
ncbi:MAG: MFS transporter [Steroidobacteraceae bacterium]